METNGGSIRARSRSFAVAIALAVFALSFGASASQQEPAPAADPAAQAAAQRPAADSATLNLHRWGAVTLFHGLPSDRVNAILEDEGGSMWFGTENGLVRYDGRNVEAVPNESALPSRRILALQADSRGGLWIGTDAGLGILRTNRIERVADLASPVTALAAAPGGEMAAVTARGEVHRYAAPTAIPTSSTSLARPSRAYKEIVRGPSLALRLDPSTNPAQLKSPNEAGEALPLAAIAVTADGSWAVGSGGRGLLLQRERDLREATSRPPRPYFVASVFADGDRLWVAEHASKQAGGLWLWRNGALARTALNAGPLTSVHGGDGELWVGTARQGAFLLSLEGNDVRVVEHLTFENTAGGLRSNNILTLYRDREGIVWFGTDRGVCRYDRTSFQSSQLSEFPQSNFVRALLTSADGETWCGTNRGLFHLGGRSKETNNDTWVEAAECQGRAIYALAEDGAGTLWAGTSAGLFAKTRTTPFARVGAAPPATVTIESTPDAPPPPPPPSEDDALSSRESVRALAWFRGRLYAAFFGRGIERLEADRRVPALGDAFARQAVCLAAEGDAALWIGTADGELWRYDGTGARAFPVPQTHAGETAVRAIAFENGRMWVGAAQGLFTREGDSIRAVKSELNVYGILAADGALWLASQNNGLLKYRPAEDLSIRFDTEQGLGSQQVFALSRSADKDLLIGTSRGVTRHRPGQTAPRVAVRRLVADRIYTPEDLQAELPLDHPQRSFLLEVTGLGSRTYPSQFQYEYVIAPRIGEPLRRVTSPDPQFAVESLTPGGYRVTVRAIDRDLVYSAPLTIRLRVHAAPFPRTTVLLASLLAIALAAAVWAFRQQRRLAQTNQELAETNAELHETRLRLANETEAERSRIARDLHDQTLADLRNLLVLTDQLPADAPADEAAPSPTLLRREIESISSEIRHICEDLSPSVLENIGFLPALEWALADAVAHLPADEKFTYEFACDPDLEERLPLAPIERIQLYRIVQEALNNIRRHARATHVRMSVHLDDRALRISIVDNGIGFDGSSHNLTGHGLANIRSRANLIDAHVEWHNLSPGCRFEVRKESGNTMNAE